MQTSTQHILVIPQPNHPHNLPPPPLMVVPGFLLNKYATLALPQVLYDMLQDYLKLLPWFSGEDSTSAQRHIENFCTFAENVNVEHLDVVLRLFVQSLDGEARKWFKSLADNTVTSWEEMEILFTLKWGEKRDHRYVPTKFNPLKKRHNEDVIEFLKRFNKLYNNIPAKIKPP